MPINNSKQNVMGFPTQECFNEAVEVLFNLAADAVCPLRLKMP